MRVIAGLNGTFAIQSPWSRAVIDSCKETPGMRWDPSSKVWVGDYGSVSLAVAAIRAKGCRIDSAALTRGADVGEPLVPLSEKGIRKYQLEAARFLIARKRALLGDAMGLGKSCSSLIAARALNSKTLVVCPSYVRGVWWNKATGGEVKKWWPAQDKHVFLPSGTRPDGTYFFTPDKTPKVIVIHYDILHAWADRLHEWAPRVVIFDEVHALMSERSRRSVAAREISKDAEMVWGLSGTPLTNRPRDLWNVVDTLRPGAFGNFFSFGLRYCDAHKEAVTPTKTVWKFDGKSNLEELNSRLTHFMLRRTAADVALELPPKTRQIVSVAVPAKARLTPNANAKEMRAALNKAADAKMGDVMSLVGDHAKEGHKVVCFTWRRDVAEAIADEMRKTEIQADIVHGGVSTLRRGSAVERAKSASGGHVLCATIDSASVGIDLSYADVCVFAELDYKPHALLQAEARLHRYGQANPVLIQYVIANGTTDELVANVVIGKLDTFEKTIGATGESLASDLRGSEEDVMAELYAALEKGKKR